MEEQTPKSKKQTEPDTAKEQPQTSEEKGKSKKKIPTCALIIIAVTILIIIGIIIVVLLQRRDEESVNNNLGGTSGRGDETESDDTDADEIDDDDLSDEDRIVYIKDYNVWIMDDDGTNKEQITVDGNDEASYQAVDWRSAGIISYSRCTADECQVLTRNVETDVVEVILTGIPFTQAITIVEWSHDGETLLYMYTQGDESREIALWTEDEVTELHTYAIDLGREFILSDGMYAEFSSNDEKVVVFNTLIDTRYDKPVMVFDMEGDLVVELEDAGFPTFDGNDGFYYHADSSMKRWSLETATSSNVLSYEMAETYGYQTSPDRYFVAFWENVGSDHTTLHYYDTGGSPSPIADGLTDAKWLDSGSNYLVAARNSGFSEWGMPLYDGLVKVGRVDESFVVLDGGTILLFDIE